VNAIVWLLAAALCSGCSLIGAGRVSLGLTATTQGGIGIAVAGELAAGALSAPEWAARGDGVGWTEGMYLGGGATADGGELETGAHAELVVLDGDSELRAGARAGVIAREARGAAFAPALALGLARPGWWGAAWPELGIELHAGPLIALEDGARITALRGYVGLTYRAVAVSRRYDPVHALFGHFEWKH
jgi:hypothetical protein